MSEKTKYRWLPWAVAVTIAIGIFVLSGYGYSLIEIHALSPWLNVEGVETSIAIKEFSGEITGDKPYWYARIATLVGLLVLFVIGPSLWIFAEVRDQSRGRDATEDTLKKSISWYAGVTLVVLSLIYALLATFVKGVVFHNTEESFYKSKATDEIRSDLVQLGYDALELYYLPRKKGGGSETFQVPAKNGEFRQLELSDLESYSKDSHPTYVKGSAEADSVFKIYGISKQEGSDPDFKNANGQQGKVQVSIEITPDVKFEFTESNVD